MAKKKLDEGTGEPKDLKKKKKKKKAKKDRPVRVAERIDAETGEKSKRAKLKEEGLEALGKLADHPLVADVVAAGAVAAVAALAEKKVTSARGATKGNSRMMLKIAGAAAAAAMGKRIMAEVEAAKAEREAEESDED